MVKSTVITLAAYLFCFSCSYSEGADCITCSSLIDGVSNPKCPYGGDIEFDDEAYTGCPSPCFTRTVAGNDKWIIRGCTEWLQGLPTILPPSDCYDWEGATFCICSDTLCNVFEIGSSNGKSLDYLVGLTSSKTTPESTPSATTGTSAEATTTTRTGTSAVATTVAPTSTATKGSSTAATTSTATKGSSTATTTTTAPTTTKATTKAPLPTMGINATIKCFDCRNYFNGTFYDMCPGDGSVRVSQVFSGNCSGPCFTRSDSQDSKLVVRGCTATQGTLPSPLPATGCYDWNGITICVCHTSDCNKGPLGISSGVSLDDHLTNAEPDTNTESGPLQCYECMNYNVDGTFVPQCPKDGKVNSQIVYRGNCSGACFTRTFNDNSTKVGRGCTTSQYGMPYPLPPSGCYSWNHETWCICNKTNCNRGPIGESSGIEFDDHLYNIGTDFVETDGVNKCYQCLSYFNDVYYPQCPKNGKVKNAYFAPCNGTCFTRNYDADDRIVARGCSDSQYGLPTPLPPDGCYTWYTEIWCVCSTSRCNGAPLGKPQNIEFDSHLYRGNGADQSIKRGRLLYISPFLALACLLKWVSAV